VTAARVLVALALFAAALAEAAPRAADPPPRDGEAAVDARLEAAHRYRESLEPLLALQATAVERAAADVERRRALHAQGLIAHADVEAAQRALAQRADAAERTRQAIREAETLVTEAEAARALAALPPPAPGGTDELPTLIRHRGPGRWSLAAVPALERFFSARFGQPLPVSAYGQTPVHERLGFDHRNALDVAVHPDSHEGRALLDHLRAQGIPFLAFRGARAGVATGAHVHVGDPSPRRL
jgi:hypothetical protein